MKSLSIAILAGFALAAPLSALAEAPPPAAQPTREQQLHIPFEKYKLPNGLEVILAQDHRLPVVAVNISMGGGGAPRASRPARPRVPALGETLLRTMMIGSGGAVSAARAEGAWVDTPPTLGVGLLEFHQLDRMVAAGRAAARTLLEHAGDQLRPTDAWSSHDEPGPEMPGADRSSAPARD